MGELYGKLLLRRESAFEDELDTTLTNYVAFIGFTILVWDHIITFDDEVKYIWRRRKTLLTCLFLINRYFTPLGFIGNLIAYFSDWSYAGCNHFVRYEGATVSIAIEVSGLMMLLRVRALYIQQPKVIWFVASILLTEIVVNAWLVSGGEAVRHGTGVHACSMVFDPSLRFAPSLSAWLPLLYDTIVIGLTLAKCVGPVKQRTASHIVRTLLKDGLIYYSAIFAVNFVLAIMIVATPPGVKNICAQLEQLLTVAMMSRITLNLKREAFRDPDVTQHYSTAVIAGHHTGDDAHRGTFGAGAWRAVKQRPSTDFPPGLSFSQLSNFPLNEGPMPPAQLSTLAEDLEDGPCFPEPAAAALSGRDVHELRTLKASPIRQSLS